MNRTQNARCAIAAQVVTVANIRREWAADLETPKERIVIRDDARTVRERIAKDRAAGRTPSDYDLNFRDPRNFRAEIAQAAIIIAATHRERARWEVDKMQAHVDAAAAWGVVAKMIRRAITTPETAKRLLAGAIAASIRAGVTV